MKISPVIFFQFAILNTPEAYSVKKRKKKFIPSSLVNKASRKSVSAFELWSSLWIEIPENLHYEKRCINADEIT